MPSVGNVVLLITGSEVYLEPYTKAKERLPGLMVDLQQATIASLDQAPLLLQLQAHITTKMNELAATIATMQQQGYEAARAIVNSDVGRLSMEAISADLAAIVDSANTRLNARLERAAAAEERLTQTFIVASIISAIALLTVPSCSPGPAAAQLSRNRRCKPLLTACARG
jgi:CHASE3 domain sensor protein